MTPHDIRQLVLLYIQLQNFEAVGAEIALSDLKLRIETVCHEYLSAGRTPTWVPTLVGPVLAAGLLVGHSPEESDTLIGFWRTCGLVRPRHFSVPGAIRFLKGYGITEQNPFANEEAVIVLAAESGRNPHRLPERPDLSDLIYWLNRPNHSEFMHVVVSAIAQQLMRENPWYRNESSRLRNVLLNSEDRADKCRRYINTCNNCDVNELRVLFQGKPTDSMINYVVSLEIAKEFTAKYYQSVRGTQKSSTKPLDSLALGV